MILVADCSVFVALAICDSLDLLEQLFASIMVPETIYVEATRPDKKSSAIGCFPVIFFRMSRITA